MNKPIKPPQDDVAGPRGRHKTTQVMVGNIAVGGGAPIVVQSMTNTDTADVEGTVAQIAALSRAGSELVRITVDRDAGHFRKLFSLLQNILDFCRQALQDNSLTERQMNPT